MYMISSHMYTGDRNISLVISYRDLIKLCSVDLRIVGVFDTLRNNHKTNVYFGRIFLVIFVVTFYTNSNNK